MLEGVPDPLNDDTEELDRAIAAFLEASEAGDSPSHREWLERYPHLAEGLRAFFNSDDLVRWVIDTSVPGQTGESRRIGGRHELREVLGRGSMGIVYEADDLETGEVVALKLLPTFALSDRREVERFHRGIEATMALDHPNILPIIDFGTSSDLPYFTMPLVRGTDLARLSRTLGDRPRSTGTFPAASSPLPTIAWVRSPEDPGRKATIGGRGDPLEDFRAIAWIGIQAAGALEHAHRREVLHRDIKPSNVMLDESGRVLLVDFGLAKVVGQGDLTDRTDLLGTLRYMAPERFQGWCDPRSDVYGLGLTLYELLTKRPAFPALDRTELIRMILDSSPLRPRTLRPEIPRDLEAIVLRAIEPEPADRYSSARELAEDLARWDSGQRPASRPSRKLRRFRRWARANPLVTAACAILSLSVIGASVACGVLWRRSEANYRAEATARALGEEQLRLAFRAINELGADQARDLYVTDVQTNPGLEERLARVASFYVPLIRSLRGRQAADGASRLTLYRCLANLGRLEVMRSRNDAAGAAFSEAIAIEANLTPSELSRVATRVDQAILRFGQSTLWQRRGDHARARGILEDLVDGLGDLPADDLESLKLLPQRSDALMQLANIAVADGRQSEVLDYRRRSLEDSIRARGPEPADWRYRLEVASKQGHLGQALLFHREPEEGRRCFEQSLGAIRSVMRSRPDLEVPGRMLVHELTMYADAEMALDIPHAIELRREAIQVYDRLLRPFGDTDTEKFHHGRNGLVLGNLLLSKNPEEAEALLAEHLEILNSLPVDFPDLVRNAAAFGGAWVNYGCLLAEQHREDEAIPCFRRGDEVLSRAIDRRGDDKQVRDYLRNARHNLAFALMSKRDYAGSANAWGATIPVHVDCGLDPTPLLANQALCLALSGDEQAAIEISGKIDAAARFDAADCGNLAIAFSTAAIREHDGRDDSPGQASEVELAREARAWVDRFTAAAIDPPEPLLDRVKAARRHLRALEFPSLPFAE